MDEVTLAPTEPVGQGPAAAPAEPVGQGPAAETTPPVLIVLGDTEAEVCGPDGLCL